MTFQPRLVALDIDGTTVTELTNVSPAVVAAVGRVVAAGVPVVISTGRSWPATEPVVAALGLPPGWAVTSNGSMVVTYPPVDVVYEVKFDPAETIARVHEVAPQAIIAVQEGMDLRVTEVFPKGELVEVQNVETIAELSSRPVSRVVVRDPNSNTAAFHRLAEKLGLKDGTYCVGWTAWMDIVPAGIDKAHGLQRVAGELGIAQADVLAIGDGQNDIEMLQWAGRGVAMADALPETKAAADAITGGIAEDGVAQELARWF